MPFVDFFAMAHAMNHHYTIQFAAGSIFNLQGQHIVLGFSHAQVPVLIESSIRYKFNP